jgi:ketosteroid isomerase-like protein
MKTRQTWIIVTVVVAVGAGGWMLFGQTGVAAPLEETIKALEASRAQALLRADTKALGDTVADDFVEISRLGQLRTKADNIRDITSGDLKLTSVKYEDLTVRVFGDVAILTGIADNTGTARGIPFTGRVRYTRVFVRRNNRWQAVLMQQTSIAGEPSR